VGRGPACLVGSVFLWFCIASAGIFEFFDPFAAAVVVVVVNACTCVLWLRVWLVRC